MGPRLVCVKELVTTRPSQGDKPWKLQREKKSGGEIFEKGRVEKVFMIWPLGLHRDRCAKARSHPDSYTGLALAETNKRVSNNGAEQETGSGCSVAVSRRQTSISTQTVELLGEITCCQLPPRIKHRLLVIV